MSAARRHAATGQRKERRAQRRARLGTTRGEPHEDLRELWTANSGSTTAVIIGLGNGVAPTEGARRATPRRSLTGRQERCACWMALPALTRQGEVAVLATTPHEHLATSAGGSLIFDEDTASSIIDGKLGVKRVSVDYR